MNAGYVASCAAIMGVVANVFSSVSSGIENSRELLVTKVARVEKKNYAILYRFWVWCIRRSHHGCPLERIHVIEHLH